MPKSALATITEAAVGQIIDQTTTRRNKADDSKVPEVDELIPDEDVREAVKALMVEAVLASAQRDQAEETYAEKKAALAAVTQAYDITRIRYQKIAFYNNGETQKESLSTELLIENGVTAEVIAKSYKKSKPYLDCQIRRLK